MSSPQRIGELMFRYIRKELTREESGELENWRKESEKNEAAFQKETDPEVIRNELRVMFEISDRVLEKVLPTLRVKKPKPKKKGAKLFFIRLGVSVGIVATIIILMAVWNIYKAISIPGQPGSYEGDLISNGKKVHIGDDWDRGWADGRGGLSIRNGKRGRLYGVPNNHKALKNQVNTIRTPRAGFFSVKLPEGTFISLNAESAVTYPSSFDKPLIPLNIRGEAFIACAESSRFPLRINAGPIWLAGPGAVFNITNYPDEPLRIILIEGFAVVGLDSVKDRQPMLMLRPGEQVEMRNGKLMISAANNMAERIAWKSDSFAYHHADVQTIMRALSRWYDVDIQYVGTIPDERFNLNLPRRTDLNDVLAELRKQGLYSFLRKDRVTIIHLSKSH